MIFLKAHLFVALDTDEGLRIALQNAVRLEHSTIPPYLYALYSLKPGTNSEIGKLIRSVVKEEMLHMTLACNLLNAIGGSPELDGAKFVPKYPDQLPGGIENGIKVGLAPFSKELVLNTFMEIEEPEKPLVFPILGLAAGPKTIGQFYGAIKEVIVARGDSLFVTPSRRQIMEGFDDLVEVTGVQSAVKAIELIVEQGEGTPDAPLDNAGDFAHYYRFAEIFHGKLLVKNPDATSQTPPDQRFQFGGKAVPFDAAGVFTAPTNPKNADYPVGSPARRASDKFNFTYTSMLTSLNAMVNGQPDQLEAAKDLMFSLKSQAREMMSGATTGGTPVGPTFEYQPINSP